LLPDLGGLANSSVADWINFAFFSQ
jgi:hypothetical protein